MSYHFSPSSQSPSVFAGYSQAGRLRLGWVIRADRAAENHLLSAWQYAQRSPFGGVQIPFPVTQGEWDQIQAHFLQAGLSLPEHERKIGEQAVSNSDLRFAMSSSQKLPKEYVIPHWQGDPLFSFQEVGVAYAESLGFRALIGDDMGLGKTWQGLACALRAGAQRVVVVTRAVAVGSWQRAIHAKTHYPLRIATGTVPMAVLKSGRLPKFPTHFPSDFTPIDIKAPTDAKTKKMVEMDMDLLRDCIPTGTRNFERGILLLNYELLDAWQDEIKRFNPDMFIPDEVHALKEPKAKRSQVAHQIMLDTPMVVGLTGTPIPNRPVELYHVMDKIHPGKWGHFFNYAKKFCDAKEVVIRYDWVPTGEKKPCPKCAGKGGFCKECFGKRVVDKKKRVEVKAWDYSGSSHERDLHRRLRSSGMVRRMKDDVLDLLPPLQETIPLEASKRYRDVEKGIIELLEDGSFNPLEKKKDETTLHELFAAAAADKIDWAKNWVGDFLEDTEEKLVIAFHHQRVGDALSAWLKEKGMDFTALYGTSPEKGGDYRFQTEKSCRVALCSYGVAREAVTLTEASYMVALEFSWVPTWMDQMKDRIRRIGQERVCNYYYPLLQDSVEERVVTGLLDKQEITSIIMQGKHLKSVDIDAKMLKGP
jgi:SWI/SNF-related matrix-associated actin-dependent regulator 1 of chromatin subfamily A